MNRKFALIIALFLAVCVCVSVVFADQLVVDNKTFANLSAEDKAVKTEIAKYSDTKIDFRKNMQKKIQDETYDISFIKVNEYNSDKVIYENDLGDEFEFDVKTGKLCEAVINSNRVSKSEDSIDIDTAHKIALKLLPEDVNIDEYTQYAYRQTSKGYFFWYQRYIGKYRTTDSFSATIGFDGSLVDLSDSTHEFVGKNIDFDEEYITSKIDEYFKNYEKISIDYDNATVMINEGEICVNVGYDDINEVGIVTDCIVEYVPL